MQYKIRLFVLLALILALAFSYYERQRFESLSNLLYEENIELKGKYKDLDSQELKTKIELLENENKLLKEQIFQLERQQFLFKSNQNSEQKYNLEENLKFKDDTKGLKEKDAQEDIKKQDDYKITPSIDFDKEKGDIGVKLKLETTF